MEKCRNPWRKDCVGNDIEVYILVKGERLPICRTCWSKLSGGEMEW